MQSSSEQPLVGEEHCVTTLITAAKETTTYLDLSVTAIPNVPFLVVLQLKLFECLKC